MSDLLLTDTIVHLKPCTLIREVLALRCCDRLDLSGVSVIHRYYGKLGPSRVSGNPHCYGRLDLSPV